MDPFRPMVFDNRPAQAVFMDGNPLTDGMAQFAASLINAPIAADQIRRQQAEKDMAELWRQKQWDRQTAQDKLAQLRHDRGFQLQQQQHNAQVENMRADNARQNMAMMGNGLSNAAQLMARLFGGSGGGVPAGSSPGARPIMVKTQAGTVLIDPTTRKRIGIVNEETGDVVMDGAEPSPGPQGAAPDEAPVADAGQGSSGNYLQGAAQALQAGTGVALAGRALPVVASPAVAAYKGVQAAAGAASGGRTAAAVDAIKNAFTTAGQNAIRAPGAIPIGGASGTSWAGRAAAKAGNLMRPLAGAVGRASLYGAGALGVADLARYYGGDDGQTMTGTPERVAGAMQTGGQAVGLLPKDRAGPAPMAQAWMEGEDVTPVALVGEMLQMTGKRIDPAAVQALQIKLRELSAADPARRQQGYRQLQAILTAHN